MASPLVTTIVHTFNRPTLLREAVEALQRQTYTNLEIILINNGATAETDEYIKEVEVTDRRVKVVHFQENQFSWDDPSLYIVVTWNAALKEATGDYIWIQEDDDFLADDYIEKMVALFEENPECTTAAGLSVSVGINGALNEIDLSILNQRPRFTPGKEVALDYVSGSGKMFAAPGTIFTIKRDLLLDSGGYHRSVDDGHILGCVPFGVTGYDSTAFLYWRHHEGQANKRLTDSGHVGIEESLGLINEMGVEDRWKVFGDGVARGVVRSYRKRTYNLAAMWFVVNVYGFRPQAALNILGKAWHRPHFWARALAYGLKREYFAHAVAPMVKPPLKRLFRTWPALAQLSPALGRLSEKSQRWN
jgi:glycosyltransferase involved in cell wall biosynthesis